MKKFCIILIALIMASGAKAQSCLQEGIDFVNQSQIDIFQVNYPGCTIIEGSVSIHGADVTNLNGLNVLTSIGGNLVIAGDCALNSLMGLEGLNSVGGLQIYNDLNNLTGLDNLTSITDYFEINGNSAVTNLAGLENLTSIGGTLIIYENSNLINLVGLNNLTTIGGDFILEFNNALTNLGGLESLISIGGNLYIKENYYFLNSLTGLESLTSIGGYLEINGTNALTSLTGLQSLTSIGSYLKIDNNNNLISLTGLEGLTSIGGYLSISGTNTLTNLTGLESLTSIGDSLDISDNSELISLTGLDSLNAGSINSLNIYWNNSLSTCDVKSICDYLSNQSGTVNIEGNATGCNSQQEVKDACTFGLDENGTSKDHITIYPNPASTCITFSTPTTPEKNTFMTIYNLNGQALLSRLMTEQQTVVDLSGLPQGIYFAKVSNDRTVMVGKFVKQ